MDFCIVHMWNDVSLQAEMLLAVFSSKGSVLQTGVDRGTLGESRSILLLYVVLQEIFMNFLF